MTLSVLFVIFSSGIDDAKSKATVNKSSGNHIPIMNTKRAVFADIGNVVFHRFKQVTYTMILPSACGNKTDIIFF